jgi:hypothetical protein
VVAEWVNIAVTVVLGVVGLYLAHSIRRQVQERVAEKRLDAYGRLWEEMKVASPLRRVTKEGPLSREERHALYDKLTELYYGHGDGMLLSLQTRNIYLAAKENLICGVDELEPAALARRVRSNDDPDEVRGWASIRQLSLLRTSMRGDIAIYSSPWGQRLDTADKEFLIACGVDLNREPWRSSSRGSPPA